MKQFIECSIPLTDPANDTVDYINAQPVGCTGSQLVTNNPGQFWFQKNTLGVYALCAIRIDGEPMSVIYTHNNVQGTADVVDFPPVWVIGPHPHHTPAVPHHRPK